MTLHDSTTPPSAASDAAAAAALTADEKRQRLQSGIPLRFPAPSAGGIEASEAREARTIEAAWIEELAARPTRSVRVAVEIANAIVRGRLDLTYADFDYELTITNSEFTDEVDLSFAGFKCTVTLDGCRFHQPAVFRAADARCDFRARRAQFATGATFESLHIHQTLDMSGARFESVTFARAVIEADRSRRSSPISV